MLRFTRLNCNPRLLSLPSGKHQNLNYFITNSQHRWVSNSEARFHPSHSKIDVIQELEDRGLVAQVTSHAIRQHLRDGSRTVYLGVDPTAKSLHLGNLLALITLLHFNLKGHRTIVLVGGATGSVGDPSGRNSERVALTEQVLQTNVKSIENQLKNLFASILNHVSSVLSSKKTLSGSLIADENDQIHSSLSSPILKNNLEWNKELTLLEFLNSVGRISRVSSMLARDSVKKRLESGTGISFTELTYQLLQAYDFAQLRSRYQCTIQIGGSDQYGNIMSGIELMTRMQSSNCSTAQEKSLSHDRDEAYGLTIPLLTTNEGEKFGKSAGNAIWLDPSMTSPIQFYQTFISIADSEVVKYLKMFTFLPLDEIERMLEKFKTESRPDQRGPQKLLAKEVTLLVHGDKGLKQALLGTEILFPTDKSSHNQKWTSEELDQIFQNSPNWIELNSNQVIGHSILEVSVLSGLCKSKSEAKRLIKSGGMRLNHVSVPEVDLILSSADLMDSRYLLLNCGKNHSQYRVIKLSNDHLSS